jgi:hypothetical protein
MPSEIDGYEVVTIGEIFRKKTNIQYVEIPNTVTHIFPYAFDQ